MDNKPTTQLLPDEIITSEEIGALREAGYLIVSKPTVTIQYEPDEFGGPFDARLQRIIMQGGIDGIQLTAQQRILPHEAGKAKFDMIKAVKRHIGIEYGRLLAEQLGLLGERVGSIEDELGVDHAQL